MLIDYRQTLVDDRTALNVRREAEATAERLSAQFDAALANHDQDEARHCFDRRMALLKALVTDNIPVLAGLLDSRDYCGYCGADLDKIPHDPDCPVLGYGPVLGRR